MNEMNESAVI